MLPRAWESSWGMVFLQAVGFSWQCRKLHLLCSEIYTGRCNLSAGPSGGWLPGSAVPLGLLPDPPDITSSARPNALNTAVGPSPFSPVRLPALPPCLPPRSPGVPIHNCMATCCRRGHEGWAGRRHLIQVLELAVLFLGIRWGMGVRQRGSRVRACGFDFPPSLPALPPKGSKLGGGRGADSATAGMASCGGGRGWVRLHVLTVGGR